MRVRRPGVPKNPAKVAALIVAMLWAGFIHATPPQSSPATHAGRLEATSALGRPLYALPDDAKVLAARDHLATDPLNPDLVLALSQALAAVRQYREAILICTQGIAANPRSAALYTERGHRELGLRQFQPARADLERATQLAPAMLDAHYHLGLAHYFLGQFPQAAAAFAKARDLAKTNDSLIDCSNWLYVSLSRAGQPQQAAEVLKRITSQVSNTEPHLYFYLRLLHFYQGLLTESALLPPPPATPGDLEAELSFNTVNYGVGNWHLYHHDLAAAIPFFQQAIKGEAWNSWGFIGSETELARIATVAATPRPSTQ